MLSQAASLSSEFVRLDEALPLPVPAPAKEPLGVEPAPAKEPLGVEPAPAKEPLGVAKRDPATVGNWERAPNYLEAYSFSPLNAADKRLNSCTGDVPLSLVCNGHGRCVDWFAAPEDGKSPLYRQSFCKCEPGWADPECHTERKSQLTAFLLSIFLGFAGADQFYLGFWRFGVAKACTMGGVGFWWVFDIIRTGSVDVETKGGFRVAPDVDHRAFVLTVIFTSMFIGFSVSAFSLKAQAKRDMEREAFIQQQVAPYVISDAKKSGRMQPRNQLQPSAQTPVKASVKAPVETPVREKVLADEQGAPGSPFDIKSRSASFVTSIPPSQSSPPTAVSMTPGTIVMQ